MPLLAHGVDILQVAVAMIVSYNSSRTTREQGRGKHNSMVGVVQDQHQQKGENMMMGENMMGENMMGDNMVGKNAHDQR